MIPVIILAIENDSDRDFMIYLYTTYNRLMLAEIKKITKDTWAAEDIMQSALVKLIDKIPTLRTLSENKLVSYIITTCRNTSYNYIRKERNRSEVELYEEDSLQVYSYTPEDRLIQEEHNHIIRQAWDALDERSRYFLESKYILKKSDDEIGADMNIKASSVRMNLTRSKTKFRAMIAKMENPVDSKS